MDCSAAYATANAKSLLGRSPRYVASLGSCNFLDNAHRMHQAQVAGREVKCRSDEDFLQI